MNKSTHSSAQISHQNTIRLLRLIWENKTISRADLVKRTGLSAPTVSRIVDRLINKEGLVIDEGASSAPQGRGGGRPPNVLVFNGRANFIVALDVGFDQIQAVVTDLHAETHVRLVEPTRPEGGFQSVMSRCNRLITRVLGEASLAPDRVCGIGVALTGLLGRHTAFAAQPAAARHPAGFQLDLRFPWRQERVEWLVEDLHGLPVFFGNVAYATANGELWFGQGRQFQNFVCVNVRRESLCSGIVLDGRPIAGLSGHGGGIGHLTLEKESELLCACGNHGCLEALATGRGLESAGRRRLAEGADSSLRAMCEGDPDRLTEQMILRAARGRDPLACSLLDQAAEYIGLGIAGVINLFDPQAIFLGGSQISEAGPEFFQKIRQTALSRSIEIMARGINVHPMRHGSDTTLMGAVSLVLEQVLDLRIPLPSRRLGSRV
jgi:predicted NBD/HSP70 family sugar kinase